MAYECFRCGSDEHLSSDCDASTRGRSAPPAPRAEPGAVPLRPVPLPLPPRREPDPPSPDYVAARQQLGHEPGGDVLAVRCGWCGAAAWQACRNTASGASRAPHDARRLAASSG